MTSVRQDFEALTPNLLARTIETVEGGGVVVLLLRTMASLRQLYTMTMVRGCQRPRATERVVSVSMPGRPRPGGRC